MRRKLVLWGSNEKDEKMLVALELLEKENVVNIYTFSEGIATEEFYKEMTDKWRDDVEVEFPAGFVKTETKLSVSDSLLPNEIKVERTDLISRAQAEWHFVVLSSKLYGMYKSELEELKEKVDQITEFDNGLWDELRGFWDKVQGQVNDKNLFREHGAALREKTNGLFDKLKTLKKSLDKQFDEQSKTYMTSFKEELAEIEDKIDKGLGLSPLFDELKKVQSKLRDFKFTKNDRNEIWNNIDQAFKKLKEKRGASSQGGGNVNSLSRVESRYDGLIGAISKMQKSIDFDQRELDFQVKKVEGSEGQLEAQLRQAKIRMIEERVNSKKEKLDDMLKTKADLEQKIEKEKKRAVKVEKLEKLEEAKEVVKLKIATEISEQSKEMDKMSDKLEKAATELVKKPIVKKESMLDNISESLEHFVEDVVDSAKAIAEVVGDKLEDAVDAAEDAIEDISDKIEKKIEDFKKDDKEDKEEE